MSDAEEKQDRARELRLAGWTFVQIAESADPTAPKGVLRPLYASPGAARNAVLAANARHGGDLVKDGRTVAVSDDERRTMVGDQLMGLVKAFTPAAQGGDEKAAKVVRDALRDYAALYGLSLRAAMAAAAPPVKPPGAEEDAADEVARKRARRLASGGGSAAASPAPPE